MEGNREAAHCLLRGTLHRPPLPCTLKHGTLTSAVRISQGIADIENNTAKELTKLGAVIQVPFRSGNQFLGEGGLQVSRLSSLSYAIGPNSVFLGRLLRHT